MEREAVPHEAPEIAEATPNVIIKKFVEVQLSDGKTYGVLYDDEAVPQDANASSERLTASLLPAETIFQRGIETVKNWFLSKDVRRYRVIPNSQVIYDTINRWN